MKRKLLIWIQEWLVRNSKTPWACFETGGPDDEGRLGFSISWNKAFIDNLHRHGIQELNDEQTVQMFFIQSRMLPEDMVGDEDTVNPEAMPNLTNEANTLRR